MYVMDIVWYMYILCCMEGHYVIMCMHDIIVIDDGKVWSTKTGRAGRAKMYQPPVLYVCTAPFSQCFSLTTLVLFVLLCTALLGRYFAGWIFKLLICTLWRPSA